MPWLPRLACAHLKPSSPRYEARSGGATGMELPKSSALVHQTVPMRTGWSAPDRWPRLAYRHLSGWDCPRKSRQVERPTRSSPGPLGSGSSGARSGHQRRDQPAAPQNQSCVLCSSNRHDQRMSVSVVSCPRNQHDLRKQLRPGLRKEAGLLLVRRRDRGASCNQRHLPRREATS